MHRLAQNSKLLVRSPCGCDILTGLNLIYDQSLDISPKRCTEMEMAARIEQVKMPPMSRFLSGDVACSWWGRTCFYFTELDLKINYQKENSLYLNSVSNRVLFTATQIIKLIAVTVLFTFSTTCCGVTCYHFLFESLLLENRPMLIVNNKCIKCRSFRDTA